MKIKNIIKKQTTVVAIAVILVVIAAIGVSYSIFFDVKTNTTNQVITAGSLKLTMTNATALSLTEPETTAAGMASDPFSYTVQNTDSNLPAAYTLYIYADNSNTVDLGSIKISLDGASATSLSGLTTGSCSDENGTYTCYQLATGTIAAGGTEATKNVRVWIDEESMTNEIAGKSVSLYLQLVGEVNEQ